MFLLIPWRVDVPQDRWPVMNWLILLALLGVFALQIRDHIMYEAQQAPRVPIAQPGVTQRTPGGPPAENRPEDPSEVPGITQDLLLRGWGLKGLLGYMWLHGDLLHLLGNLLFLWVFGNAVCAKIGNLRYLLLYILLGVVAGMAHLLTSRGALLGASGAINGVVGIYLVLFYENEVTCLFAFWPLVFFYVRWFAVSGVWMILLWLLWDIVGALRGGSNVGHVAHLGGFAGGFGVALWMCQKGWITMEKYEKSLLQMWQERRHGPERESLETAYVRLGLQVAAEDHQQEASAPPPPPEAIPLPPVESGPASVRLGTDGFIRTACTCGGAIRVTRQYAGRTIRCPRCRQGVVVPSKTDLFGPAPSLAPLPRERPEKPKDPCLHFVCACGKRIKAPVQYAGRSVKCPRCGSRLKIPAIGV
jgi:membrane associated rhomboid family serine protease/DNA-directed RNA polymerase subunit RPC12/RpoP